MKGRYRVIFFSGGFCTNLVFISVSNYIFIFRRPLYSEIAILTKTFSSYDIISEITWDQIQIPISAWRFI